MKLLRYFSGKVLLPAASLLKPGNQFKVQQPGRKAIGDAVSGIGEIFYEQIRNGIGPVYQVKNFQCGPDIVKTFKGTV